MKIIQFTVCFLLAMFLCGFGCSSSKPTPDPLAGWKMDFAPQLDPVIAKDCQEYIQKLPAEEARVARVNGYFEDGAGQHAVRIQIPLNGTWWYRVLIYDKDNKQIKAIKYADGGYQS
jgi:hypothetical protein